MPSWRITCFFLCNEAGETWIRAEELHWLLLAQILSAQKHRCWNNCWCYSRSGWQMDSRGSLANQSQNSGCTWTIRRCSWDMQQLFTDLTLQKIQNFRITVSDATQYPSYSFYLITHQYALLNICLHATTEKRKDCLKQFWMANLVQSQAILNAVMGTYCSETGNQLKLWSGKTWQRTKN